MSEVQFVRSLSHISDAALIDAYGKISERMQAFYSEKSHDPWGLKPTPEEENQAIALAMRTELLTLGVLDKGDDA
jgi:hypothetical protein